MNRKEYRLVPLKGMRKAYLVKRELFCPTSIPRSPTQKRHRLQRIRHDCEDEKRASRKTRRTLGSIPNLVEQGHWPSDVLEPFGPYTFSGSYGIYSSLRFTLHSLIFTCPFHYSALSDSVIIQHSKARVFESQGSLSVVKFPHAYPNMN